MTFYYFHTEDVAIALDHDGVELTDLKSARGEAIATASEILRDNGCDYLWSGTPWRMWVTDQPGDKGKTLFTLHFYATNTT
jgi:hypothetical protein